MLAAVGTAVLAALVAIIATMIIAALWFPYQAASAGNTNVGMAVGVGNIFGVAYLLVRLSLYLMAAMAIVSFVALRFDQLAGRLSTPLDLGLEPVAESNPQAA